MIHNCIDTANNSDCAFLRAAVAQAFTLEAFALLCSAQFSKSALALFSKFSRANMAHKWNKPHASYLKRTADTIRVQKNCASVYGLGNIMKHDLQHTIALLTRTPAALDELLRDLPEIWTSRNEGENTWSAFEVVAHLIYGERTDWIPRAKIMLQFGETRTFEPFDRWGHVRDMQSKSLPQLLDEFARLRSQSLDDLRALNLRPEDMERLGRHPAFGGVTLSQHLAAWAVHDLTHLHQISRVMAYQYREAVGPFRAYLGVLHCAGHSAP